MKSLRSETNLLISSTVQPNIAAVSQFHHAVSPYFSLHDKFKCDVVMCDDTCASRDFIKDGRPGDENPLLF